MYSYVETPDRRDRREVMDKDTYYKAQSLMQDIEALDKYLEKIEMNNSITISLSKNPNIKVAMKATFEKMKLDKEKEIKKL